MWRNDTKCKYMFMFPLKNLARKGLILINNKVKAAISHPVAYHSRGRDYAPWEIGDQMQVRIDQSWVTDVAHDPGTRPTDKKK